MSFPIVGGKADGQTCLWRLEHGLERDGDHYIAMEWQKESREVVYFYMLAGMRPIDAIQVLKERNP